MRTCAFILPFLVAGSLFAQHPPNNLDIHVLPLSSYQREPRLAVDWADNSVLMITMSGVIPSTTVSTPWLFSTNSGWNWFGSIDPPPGIINQYGSTVCSFDRVGRAYYVTLGSPGGVYVVSTTDLGETWSARTNADLLNSTSNDRLHSSTDPSGAYPNNVYVAWTDFNVGTAPIQFARSTDKGATWGSRTTLAIGSSRGQGPFITTGPIGEVYVVWAHYTTSTVEAGIGFAKSTNGGATFSTPTVAFPITGIRVSNGGVAAFNGARVASFPQMDVDRSNGPRRGWIYVTYPDRSLGQSNVYIRRSSDGGLTWSDTIRVSGPPVSPEKQQWVPSIAVDHINGNITVGYCSMDSAGTNFLTNTYAAYSTDGGDTWERWVISDTRSILRVYSIPQGGFYYPATNTSTAAYDGMAWVAWSDSRTDSFQVWLERIDYSSTSVSGKSTNLPSSCSLDQNYPNPFNPSTRITYTIDSRTFVSLKVFDLLAREVATLVNQPMERGEHSITFNASDLTSGMYFCCLRAGNFVQTRKLILIR